MVESKINFKKDDNVLIISGEDKGKKGKIVSVSPKKLRALVKGVNFSKKHVKPTDKIPQGGIIDQESAVHISNIKLICNKCNKPTTVKREKIKEGKRVRVCKKCGEIIDKV
ncbi:MAG: 50S ribosomal protein L24 [Candidatus Caldatribacteriota bacterium]|nr:50S ribosomal protein L24 [Candidatus Caldatribacteriota bacterium]